MKGESSESKRQEARELLERSSMLESDVAALRGSEARHARQQELFETGKVNPLDYPVGPIGPAVVGSEMPMGNETTSALRKRLRQSAHARGHGASKQTSRGYTLTGDPALRQYRPR